jgi:hypothetical protein
MLFELNDASAKDTQMADLALCLPEVHRQDGRLQEVLRLQRMVVFKVVFYR